MHFRNGISLAFAMCTLIACRSVAEDSISVCKLVAQFQSYQDTRVTAWAKIVDNGLDQSLLIDPNCQHVAVGLIIDERAESRQGVKALMSELYEQGNPGTDGKDIWAEFTGIFEHREDGWPRDYIHLEDLKHLRISRTKS